MREGGGEAARTLCHCHQEPYGAGATDAATSAGRPGTPRRAGWGVKRLPALAATEGQRKAWKLEAQSSLTVPMLRRCGGRQEQAEAWPVPCGWVQAGQPQDSRWLEPGKAALPGELQLRSPRASPSQSPLSCLHSTCSAPGLRPPAAQSHLEVEEFGKRRQPPARAGCTPAAPCPRGGPAAGYF